MPDEKSASGVSAEASRAAIAQLVERAKQDPRLAAAMVADLDAVVRQNNIVIDPYSDDYKELAIKLYAQRTMQERMLEELSGKYATFGQLGAAAGAGMQPLGWYSGMVPAGVQRFAQVTDLEQLKKEILDELRKPKG